MSKKGKDQIEGEIAILVENHRKFNTLPLREVSKIIIQADKP